ncbi:hypothetical protein ECN1_0125 [Escherichia coli N1]|nr:hypothetical protein ECN1_0125 [Escherichia coli N1]
MNVKFDKINNIHCVYMQYLVICLSDIFINWTLKSLCC